VHHLQDTAAGTAAKPEPISENWVRSSRATDLIEA
jgi:hypothetical protein